MNSSCFKMSAFSRGLLLRRRCLFNHPQVFLPSTRIPQPRSLTSTSILRAVGKQTSNSAIKRALPKKPSFTPNASVPRTSPAYQSYASRLASKPHPTLLYSAPSLTGYIICSYTVSGLCFAFAIYYFWAHYLNAPIGVWSWVPIAFGGASFLLAAFGGYFLLAPAGVVKRITAMPVSALKAANVLTAGAKLGAGDCKIEVEVRRALPLPFFATRKLYVNPQDIRLVHSLASPEVKRSPAEIRALRAQEEDERKKALEYERTHIMSGPFRHMSKAFYDLFKSMRRSLTREGFISIDVKNTRYKLDVSGGWALDRGVAIDRLVTIKPEG